MISINNIKANTKNDKAETIEYINSLKMSIPQKAMFIKQYYKFNDYNEEIIRYIDNQNISYAEKEAILRELGFNVDGGHVSW